ncbi:MAG TPA: lipid A deacylase LpxR family protein [Ohtaekwangia sp.]|uniref:lipid A deacylase LpxR family protein n=1 Tax=Ohtaekwangia sp. TaxID=2066019 RepID=UPI002F9243C8
MRAAILLVMMTSTVVLAQTQPPKLLRLYEENDLFTLHNSDRGYTNGSRFDLYYQRHKKPQTILNSLLLKAGDSSVNTYSWGFMQSMITPSNLSATEPDPHDYRYSGSLYISHALHSSNPVKKYLIQTEWIAGIMGRYAFARQTQTYVHKLTNSPKPMGWDHQLSSALLLNVNLKYEKSLIEKRHFEIIYGGDMFVGTMMNGIAAHTTIRVGKMPGYFTGYMDQFTAMPGGEKLKAYIFVQPSIGAMAHNTMIEGNIFHGGIFKGDRNPEKKNSDPSLEPHHHMTCLDMGGVIAYQGIGASFTYKILSSFARTLPGQAVGNISLYVRL